MNALPMVRIRNLRWIAVVATLALSGTNARADEKSKALKHASRAARSAAKHAAKDFAAMVADRRRVLLDQLNGIDADVIDAGFGTGRLQAIAFFVLFFQIGVAADAADVVTSFGDDLVLEAAAASAAGVTRAELPDAFLFGRGGAIDDLGSKLTKSLDKTLKAVRKRLAKTAKIARAHAGTDFSFRIERSFRFTAPHFNEVEQQPLAVEFGAFEIDLLLARSDLAAIDDADVIVAGFAGPSDDDLHVELTQQNGVVEAIDVASGANARFAAVFSAIHEGNFAVTASVPGGAASDVVTVASVR